jgi:hypothetical protein
MASVAIAAAGVIVGGIVTIIRLVRRRPAWPYAAATLALSVVVEIGGVVGYFAAVGN